MEAVAAIALTGPRQGVAVALVEEVTVVEVEEDLGTLAWGQISSKSTSATLS
jgi:hypothetical protein